MKRFFSVLCFFLLIISCSWSQENDLLQGFKEKKSFDRSLKQIISECGLDSVFNAGEDGMEKISFAVIDLNRKKPLIGGVNMENFIYPASVYKMYVAMEIFKQVSEGKYSLFTPYIVRSPNDVDHSSEIAWDPRPLLKDGDTVTIDYLLDLMITRSDNTAANCLIDVAGRKNINKTMHKNGWFGSEVTRKFLSRKFEDPGYDTIAGTQTSALHAALFMYKIQTDQLVNGWVSKQMKALLGRQLDTTKLATGLPRTAMFYHKTGWWSYFTNDVGIVMDEHNKFIISLFTPVPEELARARMKQVAEKVYQLLLKIR
ncbi:MAG TPA: serine hydrolase [Chitinophagaceae bacterium]|nr:serine hydrolase [Chitinophagaceae bacterium]